MNRQRHRALLGGRQRAPEPHRGQRAHQHQPAAVNLRQPLGQRRRIRRQRLTKRARVQWVQPGGEPGAELDRLGAERAGQRRVLVLQVTGDEGPHPVRHEPQRQRLDRG
jgi:hypothetical protein